MLVIIMLGIIRILVIKIVRREGAGGRGGGGYFL